MRSVFGFIARLFGRGSESERRKESQLVGMYLAEANEANRTQYSGNRQREHGKSYSTNRERA
ncbi:MAG: hypothetical protein CMO80_17775 [Verrucomicrobiales bacterium]|nr:hypothetical protein [Verrucomicrobiales bacterium]|tara:strand:+ start:872 stop:1057 length:186 start_codon:yes stop_codon:yes gene_type:complete